MFGQALRPDYILVSSIHRQRHVGCDNLPELATFVWTFLGNCGESRIKTTFTRRHTIPCRGIISSLKLTISVSFPFDAKGGWKILTTVFFLLAGGGCVTLAIRELLGPAERAISPSVPHSLKHFTSVHVYCEAEAVDPRRSRIVLLEAEDMSKTTFPCAPNLPWQQRERPLLYRSYTFLYCRCHHPRLPNNPINSSSMDFGNGEKKRTYRKLAIAPSYEQPSQLQLLPLAL